MNENDRHILMKFIARLDEDVEGLQFSPPEGEIREQLERLFAGNCSEEDKTLICDALRGHPEWIQWIADRVKAQRASNSAAKTEMPEDD